MNKTIGTAEIKARLSEFIGRVRHNRERIIIARRGKPAAALISMDDLARLEQLDMQENAEASGTHPIMAAFGGWGERDDLDELLEEIYADREKALGREIDL
jgi:prevent-host-death family protein